MTKLDVILLYLLGASFLTLCVYSLVKNFAAALFIALLSLIFFRTLFLRIYTRIKNKSVINVGEMETELSIMGAEQSDLIIKTIPGAYGAKKCENGFTITKNVKTFVACNYKFSPTGFDDVAKFYRIAKREKAFLIIVLGRMPKREVMVLASSLDISFRFVKSKKLHKFLLTRNALMPKRKKVKSRVKPRLSSSLNVIFARNRAKYFALSGLSLALFSFLGIMRIYYLITCGVCLALALFCAVRKT